MSDAESNGVDDPKTTTLNLRVTESFLADVDTTWKEEGYTSRSEFLRHAIRDAVDHPGASRSMLADIVASEVAARRGQSDVREREAVIDGIDNE